MEFCLDGAVPDVASDLDAEAAEEVGVVAEVEGGLRAKALGEELGEGVAGGFGQWGCGFDDGVMALEFELDEVSEVLEGGKVEAGFFGEEGIDDLAGDVGVEFAGGGGKGKQFACGFAGFAGDFHFGMVVWLGRGEEFRSAVRQRVGVRFPVRGGSGLLG